MFVRTVACSLEIKLNKQCLVLVHDKQNSGKTTFLRWLVPSALENYYAENISTDKDSQIALAENFIINLDELSTMSKQDINALKSMMSKDNIKERVPYDRKPSLMKRRCSFVGSTNKTEFLTDETGNVRWLCFEIDRIVWDYKKDFDINNIWVQSFHLLKTNFDFELSKDEIFDNEIANKEFMVRTPEMELIMRYFEKSDKNDLTAVFLSSTEIQKEISTKIFNTVRINPNNVGKALKILGFEKQTKYDTNLRFSVFGYYVRFRNADMNVNNSLNEIMNDFCEPVQN
jgi:predicted P-loop ATPase